MTVHSFMTIKEVLIKSYGFLADKGVENHKIDAEWLIAHALGCRRLDLFLQFDKSLDEHRLHSIRRLISRRGKREPLQHILGKVPFAGLDLKCDRRALVPRQETEFLVEKVLQSVPAAFEGTILDLGTGGGAIILSLCKHLCSARGIGVDNSEEAVALAEENLLDSKLGDRVSFQLFDWNDPRAPIREVDLVVSNPPYLSEEEWLAAEPEVRVFDPRAALVAKEEGLSEIKKVVKLSTQVLAKGGLLACEIGSSQADEVKELFADCFEVVVLKDQYQRDRIALGKKK